MPRKPKKQKNKQKQKKQAKKNNQNNNNNNKIYENTSNKNRRKNKKNKKKELEDEFKKHLEGLGYFIREVGGDGNCLFRAVAEQMEGSEKNFKNYREMCVEYIKNNKDNFAPFIIDDETIDEYIERMSKNKEWGGNLEIYALSQALEANFYIYKEDKQMYIVNYDKPKKNITLTYHEGKHYNSLRKLDEKNNTDKENEEKKKKEREKEEDEESDDNEEEEEDEKDINDDIKDLISKVNHLNI